MDPSGGQYGRPKVDAQGQEGVGGPVEQPRGAGEVTNVSRIIADMGGHFAYRGRTDSHLQNRKENRGQGQREIDDAQRIFAQVFEDKPCRDKPQPDRQRLTEKIVEDVP